MAIPKRYSKVVIYSHYSPICILEKYISRLEYVQPDNWASVESADIVNLIMITYTS